MSFLKRLFSSTAIPAPDANANLNLYEFKQPLDQLFALLQKQVKGIKRQRVFSTPWFQQLDAFGYFGHMFYGSTYSMGCRVVHKPSTRYNLLQQLIECEGIRLRVSLDILRIWIVYVADQTRREVVDILRMTFHDIDQLHSIVYPHNGIACVLQHDPDMRKAGLCDSILDKCALDPFVYACNAQDKCLLSRIVKSHVSVHNKVATKSRTTSAEDMLSKQKVYNVSLEKIQTKTILHIISSLSEYYIYRINMLIDVFNSYSVLEIQASANSTKKQELRFNLDAHTDLQQSQMELSDCIEMLRGGLIQYNSTSGLSKQLALSSGISGQWDIEDVRYISEYTLAKRAWKEQCQLNQKGVVRSVQGECKSFDQCSDACMCTSCIVGEASLGKTGEEKEDVLHKCTSIAHIPNFTSYPKECQYCLLDQYVREQRGESTISTEKQTCKRIEYNICLGYCDGTLPFGNRITGHTVYNDVQNSKCDKNYGYILKYPRISYMRAKELFHTNIPVENGRVPIYYLNVPNAQKELSAIVESQHQSSVDESPLHSREDAILAHICSRNKSAHVEQVKPILQAQGLPGYTKMCQCASKHLADRQVCWSLSDHEMEHGHVAVCMYSDCKYQGISSNRILGNNNTTDHNIMSDENTVTNEQSVGETSSVDSALVVVPVLMPLSTTTSMMEENQVEQSHKNRFSNIDINQLYPVMNMIPPPSLSPPALSDLTSPSGEPRVLNKQQLKPYLKPITSQVPKLASNHPKQLTNANNMSNNVNNATRNVNNNNNNNSNHGNQDQDDEDEETYSTKNASIIGEACMFPTSAFLPSIKDKKAIVTPLKQVNKNEYEYNTTQPMFKSPLSLNTDQKKEDIMKMKKPVTPSFNHTLNIVDKDSRSSTPSTNSPEYHPLPSPPAVPIDTTSIIETSIKTSTNNKPLIRTTIPFHLFGQFIHTAQCPVTYAHAKSTLPTNVRTIPTIEYSPSQLSLPHDHINQATHSILSFFNSHPMAIHEQDVLASTNPLVPICENASFLPTQVTEAPTFIMQMNAQELPPGYTVYKRKYQLPREERVEEELVLKTEKERLQSILAGPKPVEAHEIKQHGLWDGAPEWSPLRTITESGKLNVLMRVFRSTRYTLRHLNPSTLQHLLVEYSVDTLQILQGMQRSLQMIANVLIGLTAHADLQHIIDVSELLCLIMNVMEDTQRVFQARASVEQQFASSTAEMETQKRCLYSLNMYLRGNTSFPPVYQPGYAPPTPTSPEQYLSTYEQGRNRVEHPQVTETQSLPWKQYHNQIFVHNQPYTSPSPNLVATEALLNCAAVDVSTPNYGYLLYTHVCNQTLPPCPAPLDGCHMVDSVIAFTKLNEADKATVLDTRKDLMTFCMPETTVTDGMDAQRYFQTLYQVYLRGCIDKQQENGEHEACDNLESKQDMQTQREILPTPLSTLHTQLPVLPGVLPLLLTPFSVTKVEAKKTATPGGIDAYTFVDCNASVHPVLSTVMEQRGNTHLQCSPELSVILSLSAQACNLRSQPSLLTPSILQSSNALLKLQKHLVQQGSLYIYGLFGTQGNETHSLLYQKLGSPDFTSSYPDTDVVQSVPSLAKYQPLPSYVKDALKLTSILQSSLSLDILRNHIDLTDALVKTHGVTTITQVQPTSVQCACKIACSDVLDCVSHSFLKLQESTNLANTVETVQYTLVYIRRILLPQIQSILNFKTSLRIVYHDFTLLCKEITTELEEIARKVPGRQTTLKKMLLEFPNIDKTTPEQKTKITSLMAFLSTCKIYMEHLTPCLASIGIANPFVAVDIEFPGVLPLAQNPFSKVLELLPDACYSAWQQFRQTRMHSMNKQTCMQQPRSFNAIMTQFISHMQDRTKPCQHQDICTACQYTDQPMQQFPVFDYHIAGESRFSSITEHVDTFLLELHTPLDEAFAGISMKTVESPPPTTTLSSPFKSAEGRKKHFQKSVRTAGKHLLQ